MWLPPTWREWSVMLNQWWPCWDTKCWHIHAVISWQSSESNVADSIIPMRPQSSERWGDLPKVTVRFVSLQIQVIEGKDSGIGHVCSLIPVLTVTCYVTDLSGPGHCPLLSPRPPQCRECCPTSDCQHLCLSGCQSLPCPIPHSSPEETGN